MSEQATDLNLIGYARVSTDDQNLDLQLQALLRAGVHEDNIYKEHVSGVSRKREQFNRALKNLRRGDALVVWKLDRLGRSLKELVALSEEFSARGVELKSLTEGVDTTNAMGKFFFHIMASLAQFERDLISERTKAGLQAAKARGTWKPRGATINKAQWAFMVDALRCEPLMSAGKLCALDGMPKFKNKIPKRTTLNNYMDMLRDGSEYPWESTT